MTGTTGKEEPKAMGIDRIRITDHWRRLCLLHLVFSKRRGVPEPRYWLCTRDRRRSHTGDLLCPYKIDPEDAKQSLPSAYRIDPTRDTDQNSCLAPYYRRWSRHSQRYELFTLAPLAVNSTGLKIEATFGPVQNKT